MDQHGKNYSQILRSLEKGVDVIVFTTWDRFSRNIADAYHMIQKLKKLLVDS
ncbi:hypothetical protein B4N84_07395 [Flavobacterium sp. IR1]|nr:hypothetical protein B4N84_07395 [Flavobacterium sp. IR1]